MPTRPSLSLAGLLLVVSLSLSAAQPGTTKGAPLSDCVVKQAAIETKSGTARSFANEGQVVGLERAFSEVKEHCIEAGLLRENKQKVIDSEHEVSKHEKDLRKAMGKGDPEKTEKREAKPAEARVKLEEAKKGLEQAQAQQDTRYRPTPHISHARRMMPTVLSAIRAVAGHQMPPSAAATANERQYSFASPLMPSRQGT